MKAENSLPLFYLQVMPKKTNGCLSKTPFHSFWLQGYKMLLVYRPLAIENCSDCQEGRGADSEIQFCF